MVWIGKHRGFAMRSYVENNKSVTKRGFVILLNDGVPGANTIQLWIKNRLEEIDITRKT